MADTVKVPLLDPDTGLLPDKYLPAAADTAVAAAAASATTASTKADQAAASASDAAQSAVTAGQAATTATTAAQAAADGAVTAVQAQVQASVDAAAQSATSAAASAASIQPGEPDGVATLDSGGLVPVSQVPDLSGTYGARAVSAAVIAGQRSRSMRASVAQWSPKQIGGLVAWFRADSIAGADGSTVASWVDGSGAGNTLSAAAGAEPTLRLGSNGINGQPAVHFTAASMQMLTRANPTGIPARVGDHGFTLLAVYRPTTHRTCRVVTYTPAASSDGWVFGFSGTGGNVDFALFGIFVDYSLGRSLAIGKAGNLAMAMNADYSVDINLDHRNANDGSGYFDKHIAGSRDVTGTLALLAVGGTGYTGASDNYCDGDLAELVIVSRALTFDERQLWACYASARYGVLAGSDNNAATILTVPTPDGTGIVTEPTVLDLGSSRLAGLGDHRYLASAVGFAGADAANENPSLYVFDEPGDNWTPAPGVPFPLVAKPAIGTNADPCLRRFGDTVYLYWIQQSTSADGVYVRSTADGIAWTDPALIVPKAAGDTNGVSVLEPKVVYDATLGLFVMYAWNAYASPNVIDRRTCTTPDGTDWSSPMSVKLPFPGGRTGWHGDVQVNAAGLYHLISSDSDVSRNLWAFTSADGISWACSPWPVATPSAGGWDNSALYRAAWLLADDGSRYDVWYSGVKGGTPVQHHIGYTSWPAWVMP